MAGRKKVPVAIIEARGKSNPASREERERRRDAELKLAAEMHECKPPGFIEEDEERAARFVELAAMIRGIMPDNFGAPDADCLGRYVVAQSQYERLTALIDHEMGKPEIGLDNLRRLKLMQSDAFSQATKTASELGLTVTSRCKLVIPGNGKQDQDDDF